MKDFTSSLTAVRFSPLKPKRLRPTIIDTTQLPLKLDVTESVNAAGIDLSNSVQSVVSEE